MELLRRAYTVKVSKSHLFGNNLFNKLIGLMVSTIIGRDKLNLLRKYKHVRKLSYNDTF